MSWFWGILQVSIGVAIGLSSTKRDGELLVLCVLWCGRLYDAIFVVNRQYPLHHKAIYHWYHQLKKICSFPQSKTNRLISYILENCWSNQAISYMEWREQFCPIICSLGHPAPKKETEHCTNATETLWLQNPSVMWELCNVSQNYDTDVITKLHHSKAMCRAIKRVLAWYARRESQLNFGKVTSVLSLLYNSGTRVRRRRRRCTAWKAHTGCRNETAARNRTLHYHIQNKNMRWVKYSLSFS
jgi:hypothetical protein